MTSYEPGTLVVFKGYGNDDLNISDMFVGEVGTVVEDVAWTTGVDDEYTAVEFVGLDNEPFNNYLVTENEIELAPEGAVPGDVLAEVSE